MVAKRVVPCRPLSSLSVNHPKSSQKRRKSVAKCRTWFVMCIGDMGSHHRDLCASGSNACERLLRRLRLLPPRVLQCGTGVSLRTARATAVLGFRRVEEAGASDSSLLMDTWLSISWSLPSSKSESSRSHVPARSLMSHSISWARLI